MRKPSNFLVISVIILGSLIGCKKPSSSISSDFSEPPASLNEITKTQIVTYEGPSLLESSSLMDVKVNGTELFVYEVNVNHKREFSWTNTYQKNPIAYFDFEGRVSIEVSVGYAVQSAKISPLGYGITPSIAGTKITFVIDQPSTYIVEINGNSENVFHLVANPLEVDVPSKEDPNVVFIEPGLYDAGSIPINEGQTLYISGGAYVFGTIRTEMLDNITIRGRGILSGEIYTRANQADFSVPIEIRSGSHIVIEGIIILDPAGWATTIYNNDDVLIDNLKIITSRPNGDGISLQGSRNVTVKGGFIRTWDDSLVVKNNDGHSSENIIFDGVVVWTDLAQSMEIGFETSGPFIRNVEFRNITVVHNFHKAVISLHNADVATISDITYRNITVEDGQMLGDNRVDGVNDFLIDFSIEYSRDWSTSTDLGSVNDLLVENVLVMEIAPTVISRIRGYEGNKATIDNVTFKNISIKGNAVNKDEDLGLAKGSYVGKVSYENSGTVSGATLLTQYDNSSLGTEVTINTVAKTPQEAVFVPTFAHRQGELTYLGDPLDLSIASSLVTTGAGTTFGTPLDILDYPYEVEDHPITNLLDQNKETYFESLNYRNVTNEFIAFQLEFNEPVYAGALRLEAIEGNVYSFKYGIEVRVKAKNSQGEFKNYTIAATNSTYTVTPTTGNAIDISWTANEIMAVQVRIFRVNNELFNLNKLQFSELSIFGPSLSYRKPIVESTEHYDVYPASLLTDGNPNGSSYYESAGLPATIVIDLQDVYQVRSISLHLPSQLSWNARTQEIELFASTYNLAYDKEAATFTSFFARQPITFDPITGNMKLFNFDPAISMRYLKIVIYSNDIAGGYQAQLSEVYVFGAK